MDGMDSPLPILFPQHFIQYQALPYHMKDVYLVIQQGKAPHTRLVVMWYQGLQRSSRKKAGEGEVKKKIGKEKKKKDKEDKEEMEAQELSNITWKVQSGGKS